MVCRLCLKNNETLQGIINSKLKCAELTLVESLYWIFGVEVDVNDPYSKFICARCENVVQYVGSYRALYRRNQLVLEGKLDNYYQCDALADEINLKTTDRNEQFRNTSTSDESELSLKAKKRRLEFIKHYYKIPTTAIQELIGCQNLKDTKKDDGSLFQVNEIVNVEVCNYCSEIFTTKKLLNFHYKTKHKSGEKKGLRFKRIRKKRKNLFTRRKNMFRETSNKLLNPSLNKLLQRDNRPENFLFDVKNFPNLNFVKQLDTCVPNNTSLEITDKLEDTNVIDQSNNECQNNEMKTTCVYVETTNNSNDVDIIKGKTTEQLKTIKTTDASLLRSDVNKENIDQYKCPDLKDFHISLERCAIPGENSQIITEKIKNSNSYQDGKEVKILPETQTPRSTVKIPRVEPMKDLISNSVAWKENTANEKVEKTFFKPNVTLEGEVTDGKALVHESANRFFSGEADSYENNEDIDMMNSDDEIDQQTFNNCSKQNIRSVVINDNIKDQYPSLNLKKFYISIQRCDASTGFKASITNNTINKLGKMKQWKEYISGTLFKLQQIKSDETQLSNTNSGNNFSNRLRGDNETVVPTVLNNSTRTDFSDRQSEESINDEIQTIKLSENSILEHDVRNQYKQLNLKDFYISVKRCPIPRQSYQNNEILTQKNNNLLTKVTMKENQNKELNNIEYESSKTPQKPQKWKTNLFDTLFKIKEINKLFKEVKPTQHNDGQPQCGVGNLRKNDCNVLANQSESTENDTEPMTNYIETPCRELSHVHINQIKSVYSKNKRKRTTNKTFTGNHIASLDKAVSSNMRDVAIVIPKIDILSKEKGYNVKIYESVDISTINENLENVPQKTYSCDSQVVSPTVLNCMPQLEKETECKKNHVKDIPDEPPKLELQIQKSSLVKKVLKKPYSRKSKRKKKEILRNSAKPTNRIIKNIINKEKNPVILEPKLCKLKGKLQESTVVTKEMDYIATGMQQLTNLLNAIEIKDDSDNDSVNKGLNLFKELPINNWKEKIFNKSRNHSVDYKLLMEEEHRLNESNSLIREVYNQVLDEDSNRIKNKNVVNLLCKEGKDGQHSKPSKENTVQNDIYLVAKEAEENENKIEENYTLHGLDKEMNDCRFSKKGIIESDACLTVSEVKDVPDNSNKIEKNNTPQHLDKETKEDNNSKPSRKHKNVESILEDGNSFTDEEKEMKTWKKGISNILFKLKQIKEDNAIEQENSESCLNTPEAVSVNNTTEIAKDITEIHKNSEEVLLNIMKRSTSSVVDAVTNNQHENLVTCPTEQSNVLKNSGVTNSCTASTKVLELTKPSVTDRNNTCEISTDDFDSGNMDSHNIKSIIKSRWSNITKGKAGIVTEMSIPSSSNVDLQIFAHNIVKETLDKDNV